MGKVKVKLTASEYLAFARLLPVIPGDLFDCHVAQAAQREGLKNLMKKLSGKMIDGIKKDSTLSLSIQESWALFSVTSDLPRDLLDPYQNTILDKIVRAIHHQLL